MSLKSIIARAAAAQDEAAKLQKGTFWAKREVAMRETNAAVLIARADAADAALKNAPEGSSASQHSGFWDRRRAAVTLSNAAGIQARLK